MKLDYLAVAFLTIGSIPMGVLVIFPIIYVYTRKSSAEDSPETGSLPISYALCMLLAYFFASMIFASFNLILFFAVLGTLLLSRFKNLVVFGILVTLSVLSAFIQTFSAYPLLIFFVIGIGILLVDNVGPYSSLFRRRTKPKSIRHKDPILSMIDAMEDEVRRLP